MKGLATEWEEVPEEAVKPEKLTTPKQPHGLIKIANGWEFFHTPDLRAFACVPVNGHTETIAVRSRIFRALLVKAYHGTNAKAASSAAIEEAIAFLKVRRCAVNNTPFTRG